MGRYDRYGNYQEAIGERVRNKGFEVLSGISDVVTGSVEAVKNWISPDSRYGRYPRSHEYYDRYYDRMGKERGVSWWAKRAVAVAAAAGAIYAGARFGPGMIEPLISPEPAVAAGPATPEATARPLATAMPTATEYRPAATATAEDDGTPPGGRVEVRGNAKIVFDGQGRPFSYQLTGEEVVMFDPAEVEAALEDAKNKSEPGLLWLQGISGRGGVTVHDPADLYTPSPEKPVTTELPKDVVSEQELAKRGIRIIQADNTEFSIREAAFEEGNLLSAYKEGGEEQMTIVLINGDYVSAKFTEDERYDEVRGLLGSVDEDYEVYRAERIALIQQEIDGEELELAGYLASGDTVGADSARDFIFDLKIWKEQYVQMPGAQLAHEAAATDIAGYYFEGGLGKDKNVVFVAAGESPFAAQTEWLALRVNPDGSFELQQFTQVLMQHNMRPREGQTHPAEKDFWENSSASADELLSYPYGGQTPGQVMRHELVHDWRLNTNMGDDWFTNRSEYYTDMQAMEGIESAYQTWVDSGDDSGYYFVFRTKDGNYILTQSFPGEVLQMGST